MYTYVISSRYLLDERDDLITCSRIEAASRFVEEQKLGSSNELTGNTDTAFLAATDAFANWSANDRVCLILQTKRIEKSVDPQSSLRLAQGARSVLDDQNCLVTMKGKHCTFCVPTSLQSVMSRGQ